MRRMRVTHNPAGTRPLELERKMRGSSAAARAVAAARTHAGAAASGKTQNRYAADTANRFVVAWLLPSSVLPVADSMTMPGSLVNRRV